MAASPPRGDLVEEFALALHACLDVREVQASFMRFCDRLVPARAHGIYELGVDGSMPLAVQTRGVSDAFLTEYEAVGRGLDPVFAGIASTRRPVASNLAWPEDAWRAKPFYEVLGHGGIHHVVQAPLLVEGRLVGTLNVARPASGRPFGDAEVARLRRVARHLSVAYVRARRVDALERRRTTVEELLDALSVPLLAHTADGRILFGNRAADRLLATSLGAAPAASLRAALCRNAATLAESGRRVASTTVALPPDEAPGAWRPRPARPHGPATALAVRTAALPRAPEVLASFVYEAPAALATPLPGLSPRENEIVELLVRGLSNRAIAEAASVSENTVKQHLKRVYGKLGLHSRAELAAAAAWAAADGDGPFAPG